MISFQFSIFKIFIVFSLLIVNCSLFVQPAFAQKSVDDVIGTVSPPPAVSQIPGASGEEKLGNALSSILRVLYAVSIVAVIFMFVWGAFQWITSGGDKDALSSARKRIMNAIIGLIILALAFVIFTIIARITKIPLYTGFTP